MEQLWSPWRSRYILSFKDSEAKDTPDCFLCHAAGTAQEREALVVFKSALSMVVLNLYPYNNGHILVSPKRHIGTLTGLSPAEHTDLFDTLRLASQVLEEVYSPHALNIGANVGAAAGAGVPEHLHFHIIPRWNGDTNFMPVIAETKVISEAIEETYEKVLEGFRRHL